MVTSTSRTVVPDGPGTVNVTSERHLKLRAKTRSPAVTFLIFTVPSEKAVDEWLSGEHNADRVVLGLAMVPR